MKQPYERRDDESARAFKAFIAYLEMDADRSTAKVAQKCSKAKSLIDRWSGKFSWVERARAYDQARSEKRLEQNIRDRAAALARQAQIAKLVLFKVGKAVANLNPDNIGNNALARLFAEASRVERIALGVDSDEPKVASVTINVSHRPPEPDAGIEYRRGKHDER